MGNNNRIRADADWDHPVRTYLDKLEEEDDMHSRRMGIVDGTAEEELQELEGKE